MRAASLRTIYLSALLTCAFVALLLARWQRFGSETQSEPQRKSGFSCGPRVDLQPTSMRKNRTISSSLSSFQYCSFHHLWIHQGELYYFSDSPTDPAVVSIAVSRRDIPRVAQFLVVNVTRLPLSLRPISQLADNDTYLLYRWHQKNVCHAHESAILLWRNLVLAKKTRLQNTSRPTVYLMDQEPRALFDTFIEVFSSTKRISSLDSIYVQNAVLIGYDYYPSLAMADVSVLTSYQDMWLQWWHAAKNLTYGGDPSSHVKVPLIGVVSRNHTRRMLNENAVVQALQHAFPSVEVVVLKFEELTFVEQIELMQRVTIMIAPHSGSIVNALWMPRGSAVIQLHPYGSHLGTWEYAGRAASPPFIVNAELLLAKLGVWYDEVQAAADVHSKHCLDQRVVLYANKHTGGIEFQCFFYADYEVPPAAVVDKVARLLSWGIHLRLKHHASTPCKRLLFPRTSTRSGGSESLHHLTHHINLLARHMKLPLYSFMVTVKPNQERSYISGSLYDEYPYAISLQAPFTHNDFRASDIFFLSELHPNILSRLTAAFLRISKNATRLFSIHLGNTVTCYASKECSKTAEEQFRDLLKRVPVGKRICGSHWLAEHYSCAWLLWMPLSERYYRAALPYLSEKELNIILEEDTLYQEGYPVTQLPLLRDSITSDEEVVPVPEKEDLVIIDGDFFDLKLDLNAIRLPPHVKKIVFVGISPQDTIQLYQKAKVAVDLFLPGRERFGLEAALFNVCVIVGTHWNGGDPVDYPLPSRFKVFTNHTSYPFHFESLDYERLGIMIMDVLENYRSYAPDCIGLKMHSWANRHRWKAALPGLVAAIAAQS